MKVYSKLDKDICSYLIIIEQVIIFIIHRLYCNYEDAKSILCVWYIINLYTT